MRNDRRIRRNDATVRLDFHVRSKNSNYDTIGTSTSLLLSIRAIFLPFFFIRIPARSDGIESNGSLETREASNCISQFDVYI